MKTLIALAVAGALLLATVSTALASHGASRPTAPVPAHGSVWFGSGLVRYRSAEAMPLHGSVWFGSGLVHYEPVSTPKPVHGIAPLGAGLGH